MSPFLPFSLMFHRYSVLSQCLVLSVFVLFLSTNQAIAKDVSMAFGEKIPPFIFPKTNTGIELEIIGEALAYKDHKLVPKYYPFARLPVMFKARHVDATMTDLGEDLTPLGGFYGDPAVFYHNVFITLSYRELSIKKPEDLKGLSVVSFQGASKRYPKWLEPVVKAGQYKELNNQELQVLTLGRERYDVVLSDRHIFHYFSNKLKREGRFTIDAVDEHIFHAADPNDYRPVFWDETVRDDFNKGLNHLRETGRYQQIYDYYLQD